MSKQSMELKLGLDVIRSYKRMAYEQWTALGEFVDNSTQSYFNNKEVLDKSYAANGQKLTVNITYDKDQGVLRISDNAMGMSRPELQHAMHVGLPPTNRDGRSKYGLGMKQASCWFGDHWTIVTKKLGETTEYTVDLDVEKAAEGNGDLNERQVTGLSPDHHYTRIEITGLNQRPQTRTQTKIRHYLAGMYSLDIDSGDLILNWQGSPLAIDNDWEFLSNSLGEELRKDFRFEVNGKVAWGWVGVLATGGRPKGGFSVAHNGRMIRVWPTAWKPEEIFGQEDGSNSLIAQRLLGVIHLDQFEVSHTKDAIHWDGNEEDLILTKLKEECADYIPEAKKTYKSRKHNEAAIQVAAKVLETELRSAHLLELIDAPTPTPEAIALDESALVRETDISTSDFSASFSYSGIPVQVVGKLDSTKSPNDPYVVLDVTQRDHVIVVINMNHPQVSFTRAEDLVNYFRQCTYDALAEWRARRAATVEPSTIRRLKDGFLRVQFDLDME
jgi:Histidine kinase-, DNA gyrase B-, and HSP90-like ATPase